jgi:hypothetical protein
MHAVCDSDPGSSGVQRPPLAKEDKEDCSIDGSQQPQQHVCQINPNSILHAIYSRVSGRIRLVDEHLPEDAKHDYPEEEQEEVPCKSHPALEQRDDQDESTDAAEGTNRNGVGPSSVHVAAMVLGGSDVDRVECNDHGTHDYLDEAEKGVQEEKGSRVVSSGDVLTGVGAGEGHGGGFLWLWL